MSFQKTEQTLRNFFKSAKSDFRTGSKAEIHEEVLLHLRHQKHNKQPAWITFFQPLFSKYSIFVATGVAILVLFNVYPSGQYVKAGTLYAQEGLVEIFRDGESTIANGRFKLEPGDEVRVGSSGLANVVFPKAMNSQILDNTVFRVLENGEIYVQEGIVESEIFRRGKITTNRGLVRTDDTSRVRVSVGSTGETEITLKENQAIVLDWNNGERVLRSAGDSVRLRTDTILADIQIPDTIGFSLSQLLAIRSKLAIARTKAVNALEDRAIGKQTEADKNIASARKTYVSLVYVLESTRTLEITNRKDLDAIDADGIADRLSEKTTDEALVKEAEAIEMLFVLFDEYRNEDVFSEEFTGVASFDRYRLVDRLFAFGKGNQEQFGEVLKNRYVIAFLQEVQNEEFAIDQAAVLNQYIDVLPKTDTAREFLLQVQDRLAPNLAEILEEKILAVF